MRFEDFTKMSVWQKAFKLVIRIYDVTGELPLEEKYGLISDMRRAANSITQNIAEGFGRFSPKDKTRFYKISRGSCYELMSQIYISQELTFIKEKRIAEDLITECKEIIGELNSIIKTVEVTTQPKP